MSDKIELKELPHQYMFRKYGLNKSMLNADGKQMLTDLEKTLRLVSTNAAKKGGNITLTPATQQKIETYDRFICDTIYEYLEDNDKISEKQADTLEGQMDDKREVVAEKMDELYTEAQETLEQIKEETQNQVEETQATQSENSAETSVETKEEKEDKDDRVRIGFFDWD